MSRTSVLNKASTNIRNPHGAEQPAVAPAPPVSPYVELSARLFGVTNDRAAIAFFAVHRGEGVTRTIRRLTTELARTEKRIAVLDGNLRPIAGTYTVDSASNPAASTRPPTDALETITDLRGRFDCILIDCGALESSVNLLHIASACDGVVLVVEAGRTLREEIDRALQVLRQANGVLLGFVLNKRRYPIPAWLYRFL